jgi:hypothetical protein
MGGSRDPAVSRVALLKRQSEPPRAALDMGEAQLSPVDGENSTLPTE